MVLETPWNRIHIDHAMNGLGSNWLVLVDTYTKYPCIHATTSISTRATTEFLEGNLAHFGNPHTIVTDNGTTFTTKEFQDWCKERGITSLTKAPDHPATDVAVERSVQTFRNPLKKSAVQL